MGGVVGRAPFCKNEVRRKEIKKTKETRMHNYFCTLVFLSFCYYITIDSFSFSLKNFFKFGSKPSEASPPTKLPKIKKPLIKKESLLNVKPPKSRVVNIEPPIYFHPDLLPEDEEPEPVPPGYVQKLDWDDVAKQFPEQLTGDEWRTVEAEFQKRCLEAPEKFDEVRYEELMREFGLYKTDNYWERTRQVYEEKLSACKTKEERKEFQNKILEFNVLSLKKNWYYMYPTAEMYQQDYSRFYDKRIAGWEFYKNIPPQRLIQEAVNEAENAFKKRDELEREEAERKKLEENNLLKNLFNSGLQREEFEKKLAQIDLTKDSSVLRKKGFLSSLLPEKLFKYIDFLSTLERTDYSLNNLAQVALFMSWFFYRIINGLNSQGTLFTIVSAYFTIASLFVAHSTIKKSYSRNWLNTMTGMFALFQNANLPSFQFALIYCAALSIPTVLISLPILNFLFPSVIVTANKTIKGMNFTNKLNIAFMIALLISTYSMNRIQLRDKLPVLWKNYNNEREVLSKYIETKSELQAKQSLESNLFQRSFHVSRPPVIEQKHETFHLGEEPPKNAGQYRYPIYQEYEYDYNPDWDSDKGLNISEDGEIIPPKLMFQYYDEYVDWLLENDPEANEYYPGSMTQLNDIRLKQPINPDLNVTDKLLQSIERGKKQKYLVKQKLEEMLSKGLDPLEENLKKLCEVANVTYTEDMLKEARDGCRPPTVADIGVPVETLGLPAYMQKRFDTINDDPSLKWVDEILDEREIEKQNATYYLTGQEPDPGFLEGKFKEYEPDPDLYKPKRKKYIGPFGFRDREPDWLYELTGEDDPENREFYEQQEYMKKTTWGRQKMVYDGVKDVELKRIDQYKLDDMDDLDTIDDVAEGPDEYSEEITEEERSKREKDFYGLLWPGEYDTREYNDEDFVDDYATNPEMSSIHVDKKKNAAPQGPYKGE
jgi:hypothetical protein